MYLLLRNGARTRKISANLDHLVAKTPVSQAFRLLVSRPHLDHHRQLEIQTNSSISQLLRPAVIVGMPGCPSRTIPRRMVSQKNSGRRKRMNSRIANRLKRSKTKFYANGVTDRSPGSLAQQATWVNDSTTTLPGTGCIILNERMKQPNLGR